MSARTITVKENVLGANKERAEINRRLLSDRHILMINIMSAPGSGKTCLIAQTIDQFKNKYRIAVIEGDIASSIDAEKIRQQNIPAIQINAGGGCHLDALMVKRALDAMDLEQVDLILLENIGNLVCTADFDLGAHKNAVILSVPEGDDKPRKYPVAFFEADVVLISKIDVSPYFDFNLDAFPEMIHGLNPNAGVFPVSVKTGEGMDRWYSWIEDMLAKAE
jgi:hydrogenase nickel incorporation protein HypB